MKIFGENICGKYLSLASESVKEAHVWEHAVFVLGVAELSKELLDIILGNLITKIAKNVVELGKHHGSVAVFVVELQELQVVVVSSLRVWGSDGSLDLLKTSSYLANFLPSSSVWPCMTQTFLVTLRPRAYITSPRKKRSISPLPSQSPC